MSNAVPGILHVSRDCFADLAGYAALECYGVVGMAETDDQGALVRLLPNQHLSKGVNVSFDEQGAASIDLHVIVEQGVNLTSVVGNLKSSVSFLLQHIADLTDATVRVHIEGMRTQR